MDKEMMSEAGSPMIVTARKSGTKIYFSCNVSKTAQACYDMLKREWVPGKHQFGQALKQDFLREFEELL